MIAGIAGSGGAGGAAVAAVAFSPHFDANVVGSS